MTAALLSPWTQPTPPLALLVDPDFDTRKAFAEYLKRSSYAIDEAEDGREALAKAITRNPHIIVTETQLPGINGFDLCHLLRQDVATRSIPIVIVTGDGSVADRAEGVGADSILVKPCLPETLLGEISRLLDQSFDLRERGRAARHRMHEQIAKSDRLIRRSHANFRRVTLSRAHARHDTVAPPIAPPTPVCPSCDLPLRYTRSHVGGVNSHHSEQWDYFECAMGCGAFQYRQRTRKLRKV
jgi:DNA-binding response OmpR family regulator